MRFPVFIGLAIVAYDCIEKAVGIQPQFLFANDQEWVWIIFSLWWAGIAVVALVKGVE